MNDNALDPSKGRNATVQEILEAERLDAVWATSFVMAMRDGTLRIAFIEDMAGDGSRVYGRGAVTLPATTALALHDMLGRLIMASAGKTSDTRSN